jgi:hypothetical protein
LGMGNGIYSTKNCNQSHKHLLLLKFISSIFYP